MNSKKFTMSFAVKFTIIVLVTIICIAAVLSTVFFLNLYSASYTLARTNIDKSTENLRDTITASMEKYAIMLEDASYGIGAFFDRESFDNDIMTNYFEKIIEKTPEVELLYFSSNEKWDSQNGYWISGPVWIPPADWDQTVRPWFANAKQARGDIVFSEPFLDANTGGIIISLSKIVYDRNGNDIGVIAADMLVTKLNAQITQTIVFPQQSLYLLNKDGLYITNPDPLKVMNVNFFSEYGYEQYYQQILSLGTFHIQDSGNDFFAAEIPLTKWYLVSVTPNSAIFADTNRLIARMILLCLVVFLLASLVSAFFTYNMLTRPLTEMKKVAESIALMDFSADFNEYRDNEIGETQKALTKIRDNFKSFFSALSKNADMVSDAVMQLSSSAQEITATANEQSASISEIVSTMENNKDLAAQSAEKTYEVSDLALQTQEWSKKGADIRDINEDMMLDILNQNSKIIEIIRNLADMLSRIDESIQLIDTIADRTKIIAFNAALEASSSGEAGSRFSVVSGEIRRFADNVVESVSEIKEKISELQQTSQTLITEANNGTYAIDAGYTRMVEQKEIFLNIVDVSKKVAVHSQQITNLSKQQEMASMQVFSALKEISSGVSQFVSSTAQTSQTVEKLNNMSKELKDTFSKYETETNGDNL